MERRDFIIKSGQVITVAMFANYFGTSNLLASPTGKNISNKRPLADSFDKVIYKAIALGINAASPYNIQAWKFKIINDEEMLLFIDETKLLNAVDPLARQIHISAGCFIETLSIGISKYGYKANIAYFPEGYNTPDDFGVKAIAKISLSKPEKTNPHHLSEFIYTRQSNRRHYKGDLITTIEFLDIKRLMGKTQSHFIFKNNEEDMKTYFNLFLDAAKIEFKTLPVSDEFMSSFRLSDDIENSGDGLTVSQMGFSNFNKWFIESTLKKEDKNNWHSDKIIDSLFKNAQKEIESSKGLIFIKTNSNKYMDWIKAGRDYTKFNLACTSKEIQVQAVNYITHEYDEMLALQQKFNDLEKLKTNEKVQMILRIGRQRPGDYSYRRGIGTFIVKD